MLFFVKSFHINRKTLNRILLIDKWRYLVLLAIPQY